LIPFISICAASSAHAQFGDGVVHCEWEWTEVDGEWVRGSTTVDCTEIFTGPSVNDGSGFVEQSNSSCGPGNPCPEAPEDNGTLEPLPEEVICQAEQAAESDLDQLMQTVKNDIVARNLNFEHGTFVVEVNGTLVALQVISSTQQYQLPLGQLYAQMNAQGISDTQIRGFIHSHPPSTNDNENLRDGENFINGFPSTNDYNAYESFASNAEGFGANGPQWRAQFGAYIVDPEGTLREFEGFTQPDAHDYSEGSGRTIPEPGSAEYVALQNTLDQAEEDANNQCGGN